MIMSKRCILGKIFGYGYGSIVSQGGKGVVFLVELRLEGMSQAEIRS
jgi:hypothetical protein